MATDRDGKPGRELAVGYGNPPAQHRFRKGQSGNPNGRPRRARAEPRKVNTGFGMKAAEEFLRMEAYRPVMVREGEQIIELPAIQAVFRAMGVSAMKGNRFAQKTLAELVGRMEAEHYASKFELFGTMVEYKHKWDQEIERCRKAGLPEPQPIPHPDDIVLDPDTGEVRIVGPKTKEQKERHDLSIARRDIAQLDVTYYAAKHRRARDPEVKAWYLQEWQAEQRMFDTINDRLGRRYQVELKDRCLAPGSSRKGDAAKKYGIARG